jgi:uncharacterized membrane protein YeaQ/YmgE (transglycosylase-associated protein family)
MALLVDVVTWLVFGSILGAVAGVVMPGPGRPGIALTTTLGILGAISGGIIGQSVGPGEPERLLGLLMALAGAVILLALLHLVSRGAGLR